MSPTTDANETSSKRLSGGARGLLNDLTLLNKKTSQEMARGIAESYLDRDGAVALAEKLGVEPPRVKRRFYRYFTRTHVYSIGIDAYSGEEADAEAARMLRINAGQADIHYGDRSSFNRENGVLRSVFSAASSSRPTVDSVANLHPFEQERASAEAEGRPRPGFSNQMSWDSLIGR